ncbi:MAG TPA: transposase [bacterium]
MKTEHLRPSKDGRYKPPVASGFIRTKKAPMKIEHLRPSKDGRYKPPVASGFIRTMTGKTIKQVKLMKKTFKTFGKSHAPRLKEMDYTKMKYPAHIIIGTFKRMPVFNENEYAEILEGEITKIRIDNESICAWCIMPDHLHILFDQSEKGNNILRMIKLIKGRTAFKVNRHHQDKITLWQESFYDHILRKEEEIKEVTYYILNNPVRKHIVKDWQDYPHSWSKYFPKDSQDRVHLKMDVTAVVEEKSEDGLTEKKSEASGFIRTKNKIECPRPSKDGRYY